MKLTMHNIHIHIKGIIVFLIIISENSKKMWLLVVPAFSKLQFTSYLNYIFGLAFLDDLLIHI